MIFTHRVAAAITIALACRVSFAYGWKTVRGRALTEDYGALISGIRDSEDWCIAVTNGVNVGAKVGFKRCKNAMTEQLWTYRDKKLRSKVDSARCLAVGTGNYTDIKEGAIVRMADCSKANRFLFDINEKNVIRVKANTKYCVTNQGSNPDTTDPMLIQACSTSQKKFLFDFKPPLEYVGYVTDLEPKGGLEVRGENATTGQSLILGSPTLNHGWRLDDNGLFHTELNDKMCMQAAPTSGQVIVSGVRMRIYPCDTSNPYQRFVISGSLIQLQGYDELCVQFEGQHPDVGTDHIILENCDGDEAWSNDY